AQIVNTGGLDRLYDRLIPCERLPLIIAASIRKDQRERQRLSDSAPTFGFEVPDYFGLAKALGEAVDIHLSTLLDLAATFWQFWGLWGWRGRHTEDRASTEQCEAKTTD